MKKSILIILMVIPLSVFSQFSWYAGQNFDVDDENPNEDSVFTISAHSAFLNETSALKIYAHRAVPFPVIDRVSFTKLTILDSALIKWQFLEQVPDLLVGADSNLRFVTPNHVTQSVFSKTQSDNRYRAITYVPTWSEILNKPTFFTGDYNDLINRPTLFDGDYGSLTNKPNLFSGSYADLTGKPALFSGSYTELTNKPKVPVTYSGVTNASGLYTVVFPQAYSVAPSINPSIVNQLLTNQFIRVVSVTTTGFTIHVFSRNSINLLGSDVLLSSVLNVTGAQVDVTITEK